MPLSETERQLLSILELGDLTIDRISEESGHTPGKLSAIMLQLELKGLVKQLPGKYFTKLI